MNNIPIKKNIVYKDLYVMTISSNKVTNVTHYGSGVTIIVTDYFIWLKCLHVTNN